MNILQNTVCLPGCFPPLPPPHLRLIFCILPPSDRPRPCPSPDRAPPRPRRTWDGRHPPRRRTYQNRPRFRNLRTMFVAQLESEEGNYSLMTNIFEHAPTSLNVLVTYARRPLLLNFFSPKASLDSNLRQCCILAIKFVCNLK